MLQLVRVSMAAILCRMANGGVEHGRPRVVWNGLEVPKVVHTALVAQYRGQGKLGATAHKILDLFDEVAVYTPPATGAPTCADNV